MREEKKPKAGTFTDLDGNTQTVRSDLKIKGFKYQDEVPKKVLEDYDWLDEDEKFDGWIKYHNRWYHQREFERVSGGDLLKRWGWHGLQSHGFSSATVVWFSDDGEHYIIGYYFA